AADGQGQIVEQVPEAIGGLQQIGEGQRQIQAGFTELQGQLGLLTDGLSQSVDGLTQVGDGLSTAASYLEVLSTNDQSSLGGWYMPEEAFEQEEFTQVLDTYMSE